MRNHQKKTIAMSNHQKEVSIAELIEPLLKRLKLAKQRAPKNSEMEKIINQISTDVVKTKDIIKSRQNLDWDLVGQFGKIERQIDYWIEHKPCEETSDLPEKATITEMGESSNMSFQKDDEVSKVKEFMDSLDKLVHKCLMTLIIFPGNTKLKKRLVIYWWIVLFWRETERYETVFDDLVDKEVLIPVQREHNKITDHFIIEPRVHRWLISNIESYGNVTPMKWKEGIWLLPRENVKLYWVMLNQGKNYLNSKDIMDISSKHDLAVVQLGRSHWHYTLVQDEVKEIGPKETMSKDHIEVDETDFLKKLGKGVVFLSLQGISGISELHESIGKLERLRMLDLRACHNLENLPEKPRYNLMKKLIRWALPQERYWFNKLKVLDISECYLLDYMPKWICELSHLEVLKGFVVGRLENKNQSCQISDLSKLYKLRKLNIRIAINILVPQVFQGFNSLKSLLVLTIIWGEKKYNKEIPTYYLPKNLEKLDIRCYPEAEISKLQNPEELTNLKRLYIRGGHLTKIPCHNNWKVEILRLRFLEKLVYPADWEMLKSTFKNLKYVEYVKCPKPTNFPWDGSSWSREDEWDGSSGSKEDEWDGSSRSSSTTILNFNGVNL